MHYFLHFFVLTKRFCHYAERNNTPASGKLCPQTHRGGSALCTPNRGTALIPPSFPPARSSGSAIAWAYWHCSPAVCWFIGMSWGSRPTLGAAAVVQMKQLFILDYKKSFITIIIIIIIMQRFTRHKDDESQAQSSRRSDNILEG